MAPDDVDGEAEEAKPTIVIGIPHIIVECGEPDVSPGQSVLSSDKLPSMEEVKKNVF